MGSYRFTRMPFGMTNAPGTFRRAVDILLSGVNWQFCLTYLDEIIFYSKSEEYNIHHSMTCSQLCAKPGFR